jgi:hypothetical protein
MPMNARLLRPLASGAFTPTQIGGLYLWLDASVSSSVTLNSSNVSQWRDLSGNERHFSQPTAGAQPAYTLSGQNGQNCLTFDGSRRLVSDKASTEWSFLHDGIQPYAVFLVCKAASGAIRTILSTGNSGRGILSFYLWHDFGTLAANNIRAEVTTNSGSYVITRNMGSQTANVMRAIEVVGDLINATKSDRLLLTNNEGASSTADISPAGEPSAGAPAQNLTIGSLSPTSQSLGFSGVICEVLMYSRASLVSTSERSKILAYLVGKWGL